MKKKLVIVGLDGAEFDIIKPLARRGKLPFLNEFMKNGVHGLLRSTCPPVTAPAWTSFMTGKNPGKHGLFDFQHIDVSGKRELTCSTDCRSATLWDYLSEADIRTLLVNVPMTYPPRPINGVCIAGFPVPYNSAYVYPAEKLAWVKASGYLTDYAEVLQRNKWKSKFTILKDIERARTDIFLKLIEREPWDVAMLVISGTDHISHVEWQKGNRKAVEQYYVYIDRLLSNLSAKGAFRNTPIAVMSDHGFTQSEYVFYMNVWLMREGYLSCDLEFDKTYDRFVEERHRMVFGKGGKLSGFLGKIGLTRDNILFFTKKTGLIKLEKYLPHRLVSIFPSRNLIPNWERTKAYMTSDLSKGININLRGREKYGTVPKSEYDPLRLEIVQKLRSLNLDNASGIFDYVDIKENIYNGPFLHQAPDIVTWPTNRCNVKIGKGWRNYLERTVGGHHTMDGIFMLKGDDIKTRYRRNLNIEDVAPTVMHFLGLACPNDMDGNVIEDIFSPGSEPASREVAFREPIKADFGDKFLRADERLIRDKLRALGYL